LGYLLGIQLKVGMSDNMTLLLFVGFCGGFSTFSTFGNETFQMLQSGNYQSAVMYILMSLILCWGFILLGLKLA
jgi:CrcB protein